VIFQLSGNSYDQCQKPASARAFVRQAARLSKPGKLGSLSYTLLMQLTHAAGIARGRNAKKRVASLRQLVIKDRPQLSERPDRHDRCKPFPAWQDANYFNPREVPFAPAAISRARVHLFRHRFSCMWRRAFQNFRIVVIQPLNASIAIERLNPGAHPPA
jgi:hypothetical protein